MFLVSVLDRASLLAAQVGFCETYVRFQDDRRRARRPGSAAPAPSAVPLPAAGAEASASASSGSSAASAGDAEPTCDFRREGRQSCKASFLAKLLSPIIGYGTDHTLAQFVYDLWLWSALGGAKNASGVQLRIALAGRSFSPEYWKTQHCGLLDLQRQLGYPALFLTLSPFEWATPYHVFIEDELQRTLRTRQFLPGVETLHLAHVLTQAIVGLIAGVNHGSSTQRSKAWTEHVLAAKDGSKEQLVVGCFARLEFQDGKRRRGAPNARHAYHGSGRPHVHCLIWLREPHRAHLERSVSATLPTTNEQLRTLVLASQCSYSGSGWPPREEPSVWDADAGVLRLQHFPEDAARGIRAYLPDVLGALKSHMDVQASDGRGHLLRYVASYIPKFSSQFSAEWLNDAASDYAVARRVLTDYKPLEPEMFLQLAGHLFPQSFHTGTLRRIVVPLPDTTLPPAAVLTYETSTWRRADMSFLEFLRKTNSSGKVHRALRSRYKSDAALCRGQSLHDWANAFRPQGDVLIAAITVSRFSDKFYGQWLVLNVPFRKLSDLFRAEVDLVPEGYRYLALCLLHSPHHWRDISIVRAELELEAYSDTVIASLLSMLAAHTSLIDGYLSGELVLGVDPAPTRWGIAPGMGRVELDVLQSRIVDAIVLRTRQAVERAWPDPWKDDIDPAEEFLEWRRSRPFAILGPAGSGKSTAVQLAMQHCIAAGARVVLSCPTRMLVADYRDKMPDLDVDSIHSVFRIFHDEAQTLDAMAHYDLVVVEEVGQISCPLFERLLRLWDAAQRRPALVFLGDFAQLRGVEPTRALESSRWQFVQQCPSLSLKEKQRACFERAHRFLFFLCCVAHAPARYLLREMRRCQCADLKWKLELLRTAKPSRRQLGRILKNHKAPSRAFRTGGRMQAVPPDAELAAIFAEHPETTFVTVTRAAAARVNAIAVRHFFANQMPLCVVPSDPEANPENYEGSHQVRGEPLLTPVHGA